MSQNQTQCSLHRYCDTADIINFSCMSEKLTTVDLATVQSEFNRVCNGRLIIELLITNFLAQLKANKQPLLFSRFNDLIKKLLLPRSQLTTGSCALTNMPRDLLKFIATYLNLSDNYRMAHLSRILFFTVGKKVMIKSLSIRWNPPSYLHQFRKLLSLTIPMDILLRIYVKYPFTVNVSMSRHFLLAMQYAN